MEFVGRAAEGASEADLRSRKRVSIGLKNSDFLRRFNDQD
jgi:hypothetical protein